MENHLPNEFENMILLCIIIIPSICHHQIFGPKEKQTPRSFTEGTLSFEFLT